MSVPPHAGQPDPFLPVGPYGQPGQPGGPVPYDASALYGGPGSYGAQPPGALGQCPGGRPDPFYRDVGRALGQAPGAPLQSPRPARPYCGEPIIADPFYSDRSHGQPYHPDDTYRPPPVETYPLPLTSLDVPPIPGVAPPLGRAWYGIGPIGALKRAFQKYADFATDASRGEYWWFCLDNILITVLLLVASYMAGGKEAWLHYLLSYGTTMELFDGLPAVSDMGAGGIFYFLLWIWGIAVIVPGLALVWRRLHDSGRSGSWFFICFVPFVGNFILFILLLMPSTTITGYPLSPASARGKRY